MKSIFTILEDIEKLIYKVLMWVILIPKTLIRITLQPTAGARYVKSELTEGESRFDEYISPVILLLVVSLIPAVAALYLLPTFGTTLTSPATLSQTTDRYLFFESQTDLKSTRAGIDYEHSWWVAKNSPDGKGFVEIYREHHRSSDSKGIVDKNTIRDNFRFNFQEGGVYYVNVDVSSVDPAYAEKPALETYISSIKVIVPVKLDEPVSLPDPSSTTRLFEADTTSSVAANNDAPSNPTETRSIDSLSNQIEKEITIFLAMALMLPPLLFALAVKAFRGESIGENNLKENFYVQCYYFSPLCLAIWATYFARYYFTADAYFYASENTSLQILLLPLLLAILWFIRTEVKEIEFERKTTTPRATIIVLICIAILGFAANILAAYSQYENWIRLLGIQIYPISGILLFLAFVIAWYGRRRANNEPILFKNVAWGAIMVLVLFGTLRLLPPLLFSSSTAPTTNTTETHVANSTTEIAQATSEAQATPTFSFDLATPTATQLPTTGGGDSEKFYTEEFNTDPIWLEFMTSGDPRMEEDSVEKGVLAVQLFKREGSPPKQYFVNDLNSYSDVKVEAIVTNRGNNANGVGLICRYTDIGWYEVQFSNSQSFSIYIVDNVGIVSQGYNEVARNNLAREIQSGLSTNVYGISCKGNVITVLVNGTPVFEFVDDKFGLAEGSIGISVWSPEQLPVNVNIDSVTVSEP